MRLAVDLDTRDDAGLDGTVITVTATDVEHGRTVVTETLVQTSAQKMWPKLMLANVAQEAVRAALFHLLKDQVAAGMTPAPDRLVLNEQEK